DGQSPRDTRRPQGFARSARQAPHRTRSDRRRRAQANHRRNFLQSANRSRYRRRPQTPHSTRRRSPPPPRNRRRLPVILPFATRVTGILQSAFFNQYSVINVSAGIDWGEAPPPLTHSLPSG